MNETLRQIGAQLSVVRASVIDWWNSALDAGGEPLLSVGLWLLIPVGLLILASLARRVPARREPVPVQLLVSRGALVPEFPEGAKRVPVSPRPATAVLTLTLGNLNRFPVQWLEVAVRRGGKAAPRVVRVDAIVPPLSAVDASVRFPNELEGDLLLDVTVYASPTRRKLHRHRVTLEWDAWAKRWTASPHDQRCLSVPRLTSDERGAVLLGEDESEGAASSVGTAALHAPTAFDLAPPPPAAAAPTPGAHAAPAAASPVFAVPPAPVVAPPSTAAPSTPAPSTAAPSAPAPSTAAPSTAAPISAPPPPSAMPRVLDFVPPPPLRPRRADPVPAKARAAAFPTAPIGRAVGSAALPAIHELDDIWHPLPEPERRPDPQPRWLIAPVAVDATPRLPLAPGREVPLVPRGVSVPTASTSFVPAPEPSRPPLLRSAADHPAIAFGRTSPPAPAQATPIEGSIGSGAATLTPHPSTKTAVPAEVPVEAVSLPSVATSRASGEPTAAIPAAEHPDGSTAERGRAARTAGGGLADLWSRLPRRPSPTPPAPPKAPAEPRPRLDFPDEF